MPRILFGVSPIGLGHATRATVLAEELKKHGAEVRLFSGGKAAEFLREVGYSVDGIVDDPVPHISGGVMTRVSSWYIRSWLAYRRTLPRTERLFEEFSPDVVVGDEEFTGAEVARRHGKKRVFISDELMLGFGRGWLSRRVERRVERWYHNLQDSVDLLIVPEEGADSGNRRFVGPIVRRRSADCAAIRRRHGLPDGRVILFSMSGSGIGQELLQRTVEATSGLRAKGTSLAVAGNRGPMVAGERIFDLGFVPDNQDLISCADLVVSLAGKSTMDEAAAAGTPIISVPVKNHAEQERNASALGYSHSDMGRLEELIEQKIGRREPPRTFEGEKKASRLILSLV